MDVEAGKVSLNDRCLVAANQVGELIEALRRARWRPTGCPGRPR